MDLWTCHYNNCRFIYFFNEYIIEKCFWKSRLVVLLVETEYKSFVSFENLLSRSNMSTESLKKKILPMQLWQFGFSSYSVLFIDFVSHSYDQNIRTIGNVHYHFPPYTLVMCSYNIHFRKQDLHQDIFWYSMYAIDQSCFLWTFCFRSVHTLR